METNDQQTRSTAYARGGPVNNAVKSEASPGSLRGLWLVLARAGWMLVAVVSVGGFAASVPPYYAEARSDSVRNMHSPDALKAGLEQLSIPFGAYVFYWVAVLVLLAVVFFGVGAMIFWRRSDDPAALFFSITLVTFGAIWPNTLDKLLGIHPVLDFVGEALSIFGFAAFFFMLYLFPDGRFVPRWTRWVALVFVVSLILDTFFPDTPLDIESWPPPFDLLEEAQFIVFIGTMIYAQIYRYRRVSTPLQRQQTKWVVFALLAAIVCFIGTANLEELPVFNRPGVTTVLFALFTSITYGFAFMLVPIAVGVAVLRYRLWDIDPIVNRTLVYGALTACVVGIYVFVVGYLGALLRTDDSLFVSLFATGIVAVLFAPLRDRLQRGVNRLMYGERDDPYAVVSRLGERLEGTLAPESVLPTVVRTVREALKLPYAAITLREGEELVVAASGTPVDDPLRLPLVHQGEAIGELILAPRAPGEEFTPADRHLLEDLARQAGIAAYTVRLTTDLQRSRERLVNTREEERRRIRRDLHDGLGPMLGSLTLKLDVADDLVEEDPAAARALIHSLKAQSQSAVADIRRLVYALRPPALDDLGLIGAIRETAAQYNANGLLVSVEIPKDLPTLPAAVEVAAYRIAQEALTNAARHAGAQECVVRISLDEKAGKLRLEITDDGRGLSSERGPGVGLSSMRERAEELGGSCVVESPSAGGTRVRAALPCTTRASDGTGSEV